jgi:uncharacterized protein (DUF1330 family)
MTAYVIFVRDRITNQAELDVYSSLAGPSTVGHPATPLVFYGAVETLEGPPVDGSVVVAFPSMAEARAWYESPAYQNALPHRQAGADYRVFIVDGVA